MNNKKLTTQEKSIFCNEMSIILSSGMNIQEGLSIIYPEISNENLKNVVKSLLSDYQLNATFYDVIHKCGCFDYYMEQMVKIGEESGKLDRVMYYLSLYYERSENIRSQLQDAFTYPIILMFMMIVLIGMFVFKILPIFQNVLLSLGTSLSSFTIDMMKFSKVFSTISFVVLSIVCLIIFIVYVYNRLYPHNSFVAYLLSRLFITKRIYLNFTMANITYVLSLFLSSGYPMEAALGYLPKLVKHPLIIEKISRIEKDVKSGISFEDSIYDHHLYEGIYAHLFQIGLRSGRQDETMEKLVSLYDREVTTSISSFLNIIEPSIVAFLSFVVGIILLSVMLPLMGIMSSI